MYAIMHLAHCLTYRLAVLCKMHDGTYRIITKGADTMILNLLEDRDTKLVKDTNTHVTACAHLGLRTLLVASRQLDSDEINAWEKKFLENKSLPVAEMDDAQQQLGESLECNMQILGGTAIEDKLQEEVGEVLEMLRMAGVRTWVLTGDKVDTAIRIGTACKLITKTMEVTRLYERADNGTGTPFTAMQIFDNLKQAQTNFQDYLAKITKEMSKEERAALAEQLRNADIVMCQKESTCEEASDKCVSELEDYVKTLDNVASGKVSLSMAVVVEGLALERIGIGVKSNGVVTRLLKKCDEQLSEFSSIPCIAALRQEAQTDGTVKWMSLDTLEQPQTVAALSKLKKSISAAIPQQQGADVSKALEAAHSLVDEAWQMAEKMKDWQNEFIEICGECDVVKLRSQMSASCLSCFWLLQVLCCRVSPMQKADIVGFVKSTLGKITLAIGACDSESMQL